MKSITTNQLKNLFTFLQIQKKSILVVHSAFFILGDFKGGPKLFLKVLQEAISKDGTLIVPTYTYSYIKKKVFNKKTSPCEREIGIFSEYVRTHPIAVRSDDPLFSMVAIGPEASTLMARRSKYCFGKNSTFDVLFNANAYFLGFGIDYSTGMTGFIHLEKLAKSPYRSDKTYYGKSINLKNESIYDRAVHFEKNSSFFKKNVTNRETMGEILEKKKISKATNFGFGKVFLLKGQDWLDATLSNLNKNPLLMIKQI